MKTLLFANEKKGNAIKFQKNQPIETIALMEQTANSKYLVNFCLQENIAIKLWKNQTTRVMFMIEDVTSENQTTAI